jgi:hypothetical protein
MIFSFNHLTDKVIRRLKLPICHSDSCVTFYSQQIPAHQQSTDISCQFDSRQKLISPYYIHDFFLSQKFCLEFGTKLSQMYITVGWNHTLATLCRITTPEELLESRQRAPEMAKSLRIHLRRQRPSPLCSGRAKRVPPDRGFPRILWSQNHASLILRIELS